MNIFKQVLWFIAGALLAYLSSIFFVAFLSALYYSDQMHWQSMFMPWMILIMVCLLGVLVAYILARNKNRFFLSGFIFTLVCLVCLRTYLNHKVAKGRERSRITLRKMVGQPAPSEVNEGEAVLDERPAKDLDGVFEAVTSSKLIESEPITEPKAGKPAEMPVKTIAQEPKVEMPVNEGEPEPVVREEKYEFYEGMNLIGPDV